MARTPEQVAADDALTAAIEQVIAAYYDSGEAWILTEYLVLTSQHRFDEDGHSITAIGRMPRDSDVPIHRMIGLVEYARDRLHKEATDDD